MPGSAFLLKNLYDLLILFSFVLLLLGDILKNTGAFYEKAVSANPKPS